MSNQHVDLNSIVCYQLPLPGISFQLRSFKSLVCNVPDILQKKICTSIVLFLLEMSFRRFFSSLKALCCKNEKHSRQSRRFVTEILFELLEQFNIYHFTNLVKSQAVLICENTYLKHVCKGIDPAILSTRCNSLRNKYDVAKRSMEFRHKSMTLI